MSGSALYETFARAPLHSSGAKDVWLIDGKRRAISRLRRRHRGQFAGPQPPASGRRADRAGRQALARLQPLQIPGQTPARRAARREHLRRQGVFHQFGRRGAGMRDQDRAPLSISSTAIPSASARSPSRAPSTAARWPRSPPAGRQKYLEGFGPKVDGFDQVAVRRYRAAEKAITGETAAILVEPIQGEGGIREVPDRVAEAPARALRQAWANADLRRGAVRHRPHRQAVRL